MHGPRSIKENTLLLRELLVLTLCKLKTIHGLVQERLKPLFLDKMITVFLRFNRSADKLFCIYWHCMDYLDKDGLPLTISSNCWD